MSNEAVPIELLGSTKGEPIRYTVADGVGIAKGTICTVIDPKTATASLNAGEAFAGIAATEKVASDGQTTLGLYTRGIFDLYSPGNAAISAGQLVVISGANSVVLASVDNAEEQGDIVGKALEDSAEGVAETIQVLVGVR